MLSGLGASLHVKSCLPPPPQGGSQLPAFQHPGIASPAQCVPSFSSGLLPPPPMSGVWAREGLAHTPQHLRLGCDVGHPCPMLAVSCAFSGHPSRSESLLHPHSGTQGLLVWRLEYLGSPVHHGLGQRACEVKGCLAPLPRSPRHLAAHGQCRHMPDSCEGVQRSP